MNIIDTSSFHPRQQKGDKGILARLKKSFRPSQRLECVDGKPDDDVEGALEATSPSWEPQFAERLTEVKTGLESTVERPASRSIVQSQVWVELPRKQFNLE